MSQQLESELLALPYRELQARAKDAGLKASGKAEELVQRLLAYEAGEVPPPTTVRKSGTAAKTPRTSRRAAPSPDKAALLRAAASTPLPTGQKEAAKEEAAEEEEEAPRSTRGVRRRLSAQAAAATASPAATPRRGPAPKQQRPAAAGIATPVFWVLLLTALAAALAALAVPYCQQHDCAELARNLPELASESASRLAAQARTRVASISLPDGAAEVYAEARARALAATEAAQAQWAALLARFGKGSAAAPACHFDAAAALRAIMPHEQQYDALRQAAAAALSSDGAEPADKALAALLVCEAADDCHSALRVVEQWVPAGDRCLLHLDARHLGTDKGALQEQLASFLSTAPSGLVVLRRIDQMAPELLPVLINALSEQGAFQQGGQPVPTTRATFLLTSLMPDVFAHLSEEIKFKQEAKTRLVVDLALRAADQDTAKSQANALRRRIDFVIPIGQADVAAESGAAQASCQLQVPRLLQQLLPSGANWEGLRSSAAAALAKRLGTKAPVALLACDHSDGCDSLAAEAQRASASPACVLTLEGVDLRSSKELSSHIAAFIRRVPGGTVVLNRVDKIPVELLSVLVEALVPDGKLDAADGAGAVSTVGTTFLLTAHAPHEVFVHMSDEHRFRQDAQLHLAAEFQSRATNKQAATILAEALHHRIDTVVPVGSSPAAYEASAAHQAAARRSQGDPSEWEVKPEEAAALDGGAAAGEQPDIVAEAIVS